MTDTLICWVDGEFAESAYLGAWYLGAIFTVNARHFVVSLDLPDQAHQRTPHSSRDGAKSFAEQRVREFLAFAELPGRI